MPPKTIRFPDDLAEKIQAKADATDRSFSYVVLRALESALNGQPKGGKATGHPVPPSAPSRTSAAMARQAKLNAAKAKR